MKLNKLIKLSALGIAFTGIAMSATSVHTVSAAKGDQAVIPFVVDSTFMI